MSFDNAPTQADFEKHMHLLNFINYSIEDMVQCGYVPVDTPAHTQHEDTAEVFEAPALASLPSMEELEKILGYNATDSDSAFTPASNTMLGSYTPKLLSMQVNKSSDLEAAFYTQFFQSPAGVPSKLITSKPITDMMREEIGCIWSIYATYNCVRCPICGEDMQLNVWNLHMAQNHWDAW
ncbi:hypothetical protein CPB84DRAFT_1809913 [Gymnopilus junonius]|uniref:Uncharacterized protein n=1 Tax=Gymnopilus junonius TaxID=109634 RepID=A0A9P5N701_GYMJU|nr:hypothetical protein CPB84DRAFT_1809913 [Gymnopilus junonius]